MLLVRSQIISLYPLYGKELEGNKENRDTVLDKKIKHCSRKAGKNISFLFAGNI
jgi:hypothetical protein